MKVTHLMAGVAGFAVGAAIVLAAAVTSAPPAVPPALQAPANTCHAQGPLPDPVCTPGAANPDVTQATIGQTICVSGWTAKVRPPESVTAPIKTERMAAYGFTGPQSGYELDHLIPLEVGGATGSHPGDIANLWPEAAAPAPGFHQKDAFENYLKAQVCAGSISLVDAQHEIATDWLKYWQAAGSPKLVGAPE